MENENLNELAETMAGDFFPSGQYRYTVKRLILVGIEKALDRVKVIDGNTNIDELKEELKGKD